MAKDVPNDALTACVHPRDLPPENELANFLGMMRIAMGLPPDALKEKPIGCYVIVEGTAQRITLFRNRQMLLQVSWSGYPERYAARSAIPHPVAPMGDMLETLPADGEGKRPISREQAMQIAYTMLRYLTVEDGSRSASRSGLSRKAVKTA